MTLTLAKVTGSQKHGVWQAWSETSFFTQLKMLILGINVEGKGLTKEVSFSVFLTFCLV